MAIARDLFRVNQRVQLTEEGRRQLLGPQTNWRGAPGPTTGIVRGFGRHSLPQQAVLVRVQRDGRATVDSYHMRFWEPVEEESTP